MYKSELTGKQIDAALKQIGTGGVIGLDLLWENASVTSSFAAQTVEIDGAGYTHFMILVGYNTSAVNGVRDNWLRFRPGSAKTDGCLVCDYFTSSSEHAETYRQISLSGDKKSVNFGGGYSVDGTANDTRAIPYAIYGVKGVS